MNIENIAIDSVDIDFLNLTVKFFIFPSCPCFFDWHGSKFCISSFCYMDFGIYLEYDNDYINIFDVGDIYLGYGDKVINKYRLNKKLKFFSLYCLNLSGGVING